MEIRFHTAQLARLCNSEAALNSRYGRDCARQIRRRLQQLEAVESLVDMTFGRLRELEGAQAGQISLDLAGSRRLIARPTADPPPRKPDGRLRRSKVRSVTILGIADTDHR
jgi:proteic killer suppression protein